MTPYDCAEDLRQTVEKAARALVERLPEADAALRPAPGKWSPKEIVGHLIDSASNNHQRFIRAQFTGDELVFPGYEQDEWVRVQDYNGAPWRATVELWRAFNLHLARAMELVPEETRLRPRPKHNLHLIAWKTVPESEPATLDYFMRDYVGHLKHHVRQILPDLLLPDLPRAT